MNPNQPERACTGSLPLLISDGNYTAMTTSRDKVEEVWALLDYHTTIPETMDEFLKSKGITQKAKRERVAKELSAYVQQAKNFYSYARNSDYRSAALLYYYSFMNLAKAKLVIERPEFVGKKFTHGIYGMVKTGDLKHRTVRAFKTDKNMKKIAVFNELYNLRFGSYIPINKSLSLKDLLGYSSDIGSEYTQVFGQRNKFSGVKYASMIDNNRRKSWILLAIHDSGRLKQYTSTFQDFFNEFEQVDISPLTRSSVFKISGFANQWYGMYQSKTEFDYIGTDGLDIWSGNALIKKLIGKNIQYSVYDSDNGFEIIDPLKKQWQLPMDEMLAIYATMFDLSEIVRYDPSSLNSFLSDKTKDGWLLKSFIESSSFTFLIRMASWITGDDYYLHNR
jgi:hypothetical protein